MAMTITRFTQENYVNMSVIGMIVKQSELREKKTKYVNLFVSVDSARYSGRSKTIEDRLHKAVVFRCMAFGYLAEYISAHYKVGDIIFITGADPERVKFRDGKGKFRDEIQWVIREINAEEVLIEGDGNDA